MERGVPIELGSTFSNRHVEPALSGPASYPEVRRLFGRPKMRTTGLLAGVTFCVALLTACSGSGPAA